MPKEIQPEADSPIPVTVLVAPNVLLMDLAAVLEPLRLANEWLEQQQRPIKFNVRCVGPAMSAPSAWGLALGKVSTLPKSLPEGSWLVLPGAMRVATAYDTPTAEQIADWARRMAPFAGHRITVCSGALLAARAGWLDGHSCTTHHDLIDRLRREAPNAKVLEDRIFVVDRTLATSAGITAGIDLMLHLIGTVLGSACEIALARELVVYRRRAGADAQLSPYLSQRNHLHPAVHRVQDAILADCAASWTLARMAEVAHVTERHLNRLFAEHAQCTPMQYLQRLRVARAKTLLTTERVSIERVATEAGFSSAHHLRRAWRAIEGGSPTAFLTNR
jgi:transcriptional regulator GlxA family with amidase domain